jgi:outer membrane lipoprotein-sorting protein
VGWGLFLKLCKELKEIEMKNKITLLIIICTFLFSININANNKYPSGSYILKEMDKVRRSETQMAVSTMIIRGRRGVRKLKAKSWSKGSDQSFSEYLSPPRDKGTKMLKLKDELWVYSPMADRIIKIAGHMLKQSVMGSDFSYEDFMSEDALLDSYEAKVIGEEIINKRSCYILKLQAKKEGLAYNSRKLWVDKTRFIALKGERFAKSGKLLKTTEIKEIFRVESRWYPKRMIFKDVLKTGSGTELIIDSIKFDVKIPNYIFTKASLR